MTQGADTAFSRLQRVKLAAHRAGLPGEVIPTLVLSALTPVLESVAANPAYKAGHSADFPVKVLMKRTRRKKGED